MSADKANMLADMDHPVRERQMTLGTRIITDHRRVNFISLLILLAAIASSALGMIITIVTRPTSLMKEKDSLSPMLVDKSNAPVTTGMTMASMAWPANGEFTLDKLTSMQSFMVTNDDQSVEIYKIVGSKLFAPNHVEIYTAVGDKLISMNGNIEIVSSGQGQANTSLTRRKLGHFSISINLFILSFTYEFD